MRDTSQIDPADTNDFPARFGSLIRKGARAIFNAMTGGPEITILLVRHGESEGNVDASLYIQKGDSNIEETELGWRQARAAGAFLDDYYRKRKMTKWPTLYVSEYKRTLQTFAGMRESMKGSFEGDPRIFHDPRLVEKFFGAASGLHFPPDGCHPETIATLKLLSQMVYAGDPLSAANLFGESTLNTRSRVKGFIDGSLQRDLNEGQKDFLFVTHGAVIQAFIMNWAHVWHRDKDLIGNPGNCDIIEIRGRAKKWRITKIYDGEKMEPARKNMLAGIKPFTVADLPPVPPVHQDEMRKTGTAYPAALAVAALPGNVI